MSESQSHALNAMHPKEGTAIRTAIAVSTPTSIDCTDYMVRGVMVRIASSVPAVAGYKFSADPVANISTSSTSGADACTLLSPNGAERGFIPQGMPYLHVVSAAAGSIYVSDASDIR